jgi:probable HAF family extracellular repeat protein
MSAKESVMRDFCKQVLSFAVLCSAFAATAAAQTSYTVTDLGTLSSSNSAKVSDINKSGQIVGTSANHAFLWSNGVMTDLGTLGGSVSMAYSINDNGVVVGEAATSSGEMHAFVWQNGAMKDLGVAGETSAARGINSKDDIVGVAYAKNVRGGAMLWSGGQRQPLGDLGPSGSGSTAISINDKGQIAGVSSGFSANQGVVRAVVWLNGAISDLGALGGLHSTANAINAQALVVGWAEVADNSTAAFQWQNGKMSQLASLPGSVTSVGNGTQATAVNDSGVIVGSCVTSTGETHAVIWSNGKITDLNSLIPQTGLTLTRATGINRSGLIVVEQQSNLDGPTTRAYLLTPKTH